MLPVEGLTDVVSYLPLYDLDSVLLTNRRLSNVAFKCVKDIRVWEFDHVFVYVRHNSLALREMVRDHGDDDGRDTLIDVDGRANITKLLDIVLHNALFKVLKFIVSPGATVPLPNESALMVRKLELSVKGVPSADFLVDIIASFRKVQVRSSSHTFAFSCYHKWLLV